MGAIENEKVYGIKIRESANDGSDFSNPDADYRMLFVGEDGLFHLKDSAGTVTTPAQGALADPMTTRGDVIVRNASNVTARLAIGSSGKVLSSDGTDVSWQTPAGGGGGALVLLEQHTANNTSVNLDFTTFLSATYDEYLFEIVGIYPATNAVTLGLRCGTGGGPTYDTGANYSWNGWSFIAAGGATIGSAADTSMEIRHNMPNTGNYTANGSLRLFNIASNYPTFTGQTTGYTTNNSTLQTQPISGAYLSTTALTAVRFFSSSGNLASGTIRVYGIAKT